MISYLIKIKNKVQFTDVVEVFVEDLHKVMNSLQIDEVVVCNVHTYAEVEARISSVDYFEVSELQGRKRNLSQELDAYEIN